MILARWFICLVRFYAIVSGRKGSERERKREKEHQSKREMELIGLGALVVPQKFKNTG